MAKPLPVASPGAPGGSKSTIGGGKGISEPSHRPRHRRHRPSKSPLSSFTPSSGLLILLASVASASTVSGSPAPPSFLCPSIGTEDDEASSINKRAPPSSSVTVTPTPSESNDVLLPRHVPDRYRQDADGVWRRMGTYTLYGSTVSACSGTCRQPTNAVSAVDDQIQVSGNTDTTNNTTTLNQLDDIRDSLPPGWKPVPKPNASRTPLILAVSLVLAFLICSFIIGCLFWRKTVKKNHRSHDVEAKAKRKKSAAKEESIIAEKEHKSKQKIWARATARWKANVRYTARQRRGKRFSSRASAQQSTLSLDRSRSRLAGSTSSIRSAASSRRSSTSSVRNPIHDEEVNPTSPTSVEIPSSPPSSPPTQATANNPPAYQHRGQIPPIIISSDDTTVDGYPTTPQFGRSRRPSHSSNYSASAITNDGQMVEISPTPLHAAHVATDDKSLLARLAELASSPPTDDCSTSAGTSEVQVSAPVWQDDDIEDFAPELAPSPSQSSTTPTLFPPPPSKELLAASQFYSYPFSFEEMESLEAECGPSAPPFEEGASPPLQDSHLLVPSAPPLLEDNDRIWDVHPSAPEWDDSSPAIDSCEENVAGQDHDRIATESDVPRPSAPSSSPPPRTPTPPIGPSSPCPANDSSITLPSYQP